MKIIQGGDFSPSTVLNIFGTSDKYLSPFFLSPSLWVSSFVYNYKFPLIDMSGIYR